MKPEHNEAEHNEAEHYEARTLRGQSTQFFLGSNKLLTIWKRLRLRKRGWDGQPVDVNIFY